MTEKVSDKINISADAQTFRPSFFFALSLAFLSALTVFLVFSPVLISHGFIFDDRYLLLENPYLKSWSNTLLFFSRDVTEASSLQVVSGYYRPLSMVLIQILYHLFEFTAWKYHAFSLVLHAFNSFFCGWLAFRISANRRIALWATLFFAAHPVHCEAVIPFYNYMQLASAAGAVLSVAAYLKGIQTKKSLWYFLSFLSYASALYCKEDVLFLPVFLFFLNDLSGGWRPKWRAAMDLLPWGFAAALYLGMRFLFVNHGAAFGFWEQATLENLNHSGGLTGTVWGVVMTWLGYLKLWIWPHPLSAFHMLSMPTHAGGWLVFLGALFLAIAAVVAAMRLHFLKTAWIWFFVFIFPVLNIIPIGGMFNERHLYLPSMALAWMFAWGIDFCVKRCFKTGMVFAVNVCVAAVVVVYAFLSMGYSSVWLSDDALWRRGHQLYPQAADPLNKMAKTFYDAGDLISAADYYDRAADLEKYPSREIEFRRKAAQAFGLKSRFDLALQQYQMLVKLAPEDEIILFEWGWTYFLSGDLDQAEAVYRGLLVQFPDSARGYYGLSEVAFRRERLEEGRKLSLAALEKKPHEALALRILSNLQGLS